MRLLRGFAPCLIVLVSVGANAATYVVPKDAVLIDRSDAIVVARGLHSDVQESTERGIETVTLFAVEEVVAGDGSPGSVIRVREPGGIFETNHRETKIEMVPGAPRFADGDHVLLFLRNIGAGDYATTDFALGSFAFAADDLGHRVLIRAGTEIVGWDPDGSVHHEPRRDADRFLAFIRDVVHHRPASGDYTIKAEPLAGDSRSITNSRPSPSPLSAFTVTQYTYAASGENGQGFRWKFFPAAVNWNRGNAAINDGNSGSDTINLAFGSWNGDPSSNVNYVLASTNANSNGLYEPADGVNNVVFEKNLQAQGFSPFSCMNGGVLGVGGLHASPADPTNTVNGEVFFRIVEADVSMNQGVGACLPGGAGTLSTETFHSAVAHEVGHTLGFRHSDQSRDYSQACTNFASYDCSSSALMNHIIVAGLNGALTAWDQRAVAALYPSPPAAPTNVIATAATPTSVTLTWIAVAGATSYTVYRSANNATYSMVGTPATNTFTDNGAFSNTAYLYKVTASGSGGVSSDSNRDLATTVIFTDPVLTAQVTAIKAVHLTELRTAIDAVRKLANGGMANGFNYTDPAVTAQSTPVRGIHVIDLRSALDAARSALGLPALSYTDPSITPQSTLIRAMHFAELRNGVR